MKRTHVTSETIRSIGYNEATQTLEVQFIDGDVYQYYNVPPDEADTFLHRPVEGSYGKHVNFFIKERYDFRKME